MRRGEVRWADLEPKRRPVIVLTRDAVVDRLRSVLVAPCTTTERGLPSEVALGEDDGLPKPCVVNLDNVSLVDAGVLGPPLVRLDRQTMARLCEGLTFATGCDQ